MARDPKIAAPSRPSSPRPTGRGRPPSIDSEHLLGVARQVFLERGIRATTLEVAERAGVSEGVLFHRFKSKEGLFSAAMDFDRESAPQRLLEAIAGIRDMEPRDGIAALATTMLEVGRVALPILMMSWSNPQPCIEPMFAKKSSKFRDVVKALAAHFEQQMDQGKLRHMDSELLARALLGAVHHFALTRILLEEGDGAVMPEGMFVRGLADLILNGAGVPESSTPRNPRFAARS